MLYHNMNIKLHVRIVIVLNVYILLHKGYVQCVIKIDMRALLNEM